MLRFSAGSFLRRGTDAACGFLPGVEDTSGPGGGTARPDAHFFMDRCDFSPGGPRAKADFTLALNGRQVVSFRVVSEDAEWTGADGVTLRVKLRGWDSRGGAQGTYHLTVPTSCSRRANPPRCASRPPARTTRRLVRHLREVHPKAVKWRGIDPAAASLPAAIPSGARSLT